MRWPIFLLNRSTTWNLFFVVTFCLVFSFWKTLGGCFSSEILGQILEEILPKKWRIVQKSDPHVPNALHYSLPYLAPFVWSPEPEANESQRDGVGDFETVVCGDQVLEIVCQLHVTSDVLTERLLTIKSHHEPQLQGSKTPAQSFIHCEWWWCT